MQCAKLTEDLYNTSYEDLNSVSIGKAKPSAASPNRPDEVSFTDKMYKAFGGANRGGSKVAERHEDLRGLERDATPAAGPVCGGRGRIREGRIDLRSQARELHARSAAQRGR